MKLNKIVIGVSAILMCGSAGIYAATLNQQVDALSAKLRAVKQAGNTQNSVTDYLHRSTGFSASMTSDQRSANDTLRILKAKQTDLQKPGFYVGGKIENIAEYIYRNPQNSQGSSSSNITNTEVMVNSTFVANNWLTGYLNARVSQYQSFGSTSLDIDDAYLVLGNLKQMPFYGFIGKGRVNFGRMTQVSNQANAFTETLFLPQSSAQLGIGYYQSGLNLTLTVLNGGGSTGSRAYTPNATISGNFAANASFEHKINAFDWYVGAGYINGSNEYFKKSVTPSDNTSRNAAWDINTGFKVQNFKAMFEYLQTVDQIAGFKLPLATINNSLTYAAGSQFKSWMLGAQYDATIMGKNTAYYAQYSEARAANDNRAGIFDIGLRSEIFNNIWLGGSYLYVSAKKSDSETDRGNVFVLDAIAYF